MKHAKPRLVVLLVAGLVIVGLPLAGKWLRRNPDPRCALDGLKIEPLYQVRVVDRARRSHRFCCVRCAGRWLARQSARPVAIYVTDQTSGAQIDHRTAYFVQSTVITNAVTGNRVHVFRDRSAAEKHVHAFGGRVLSDAERSLQLETGSPFGLSYLRR